MRTSPRGRTSERGAARHAWRAWAEAASVCVLLVAAEAAAQVRVDALTEVRRIRITGAHSISERRLRELVQTRDRGSFYSLRVALGKIPFVPGPTSHPFSPFVLQQDVVRIRREYFRSGFPGTSVRYDVTRHATKNLLDVTFVIEEGRPLIVADVVIANRDSLLALPVTQEQRKSWSRLERTLQKQRGRRLDVDDARMYRDRLEKWWRDRGYPRAAASMGVQRDTARSEIHLSYRMAPGAMARFGEIQVQGNHTVSETTVRRQVPIEPGTPYSAARLERARLDLQELDIVRVASVDVPLLEPADTTTAVADSLAAAPLDSVLPVRVQITEADRHLVSGDVGYVTDAGVSSQARWAHRNWSGGGRSLTLTGLAQTGWWALVENPDERYRLAISLKQPAIFGRRTSGVLTPFVEHRDDTQDRSTQYGLNTTLVYRIQQLTSVSLDYQIAKRQVYEYRLEDLASGDIDLLTFLVQVAQGQLDSLGTTLNSSTFTLAGNWSALDDPANPHRGVIVRPAVQVTAPDAWSSTEYWRVDAAANGYVPLGHSIVFSSRLAVGRLFPFGKSIPEAGENAQSAFLQLRDVSFTAGGTGDARGWENRLLGPKVPDVRFTTVGDSLVPSADNYVPLGGFARASFSLELQMPLPGFGPNFGSHVFFDGGRVWTGDTRFISGDPYDQQRLFVATGGGLNLRTPVGPIKLSVGYKLNPSILDLVDAGDALQASQEHRPLGELHQHNSRRWQFHLAIGASY
jgi:outer membrane protein insertion porin family